MPQLGTRIGEEIDAELTSRGDRNTVARETLERYFTLLAEERRSLRRLLTPEEQTCIAAAFSGTIIDKMMMFGRYVQGDRTGPLLAAEIEDAIRYETVSGPADPEALLAKLNCLSRGECAAVLDAVERFWRRVAAGEDADPHRLLEG